MSTITLSKVSNSSDWAFSTKDSLASDIFSQAYNDANSYWAAYGPGSKSLNLTTSAYSSMGVMSRTKRYWGAYGQNFGYGGVTGGADASAPASLNMNVSGSVIDTLTAKLSSLGNLPQLVTDRATAKGRRDADDLNHLARAMAYNHDMHGKMVMAYKNAMVNKAGFIKIVPDPVYGIRLELVLPDEITVEQNDGYYNNPSKILHTSLVSTEHLVREYPEFETQIRNSRSNTMSLDNSDVYSPATIVIEGWCKNTYKKKGRHTICIENCVLVDEEWNHDWMPIEKVDFLPPLVGYWGYSVIDELQPLQNELNTMLSYLKESFRLVVRPRVLIDDMSEINTEALTNEIGGIIRYNGNGGSPPIIHNGSAIPPEAFRWVEYLISFMYQKVGLSPIDIQGQKQVDLVSSKALKTYNEIKSERWADLQNRFQKSFVSLTYKMLEMMRLSKFSYESVAFDDKIGLRKVSSTMIPKNLKKSVIIQFFSTSSLPNDIEGRIEYAQKLVQMGALDPRRLPDILKLPDTGAVTMLQTSPVDYIDQTLERIVSEGVFLPPEEEDDLDYALQASSQMYNFVRLNNGTEDQKRLLRRYIREVKTLIKQREDLKLSQLQEVQQRATQQAVEALKRDKETQNMAMQEAKKEILTQNQIDKQAQAMVAAQEAQAIAESQQLRSVA